MNKDEKGELKGKSEIDERKTLKELIDNKNIDIKKLFEIMPSDDEKNIIKIRLKRPQDFEEE